MAGVTRWQHYLYSYKSMCVSIVQPFEDVSYFVDLLCGSLGSSQGEAVSPSEYCLNGKISRMLLTVCYSGCEQSVK